VARRVRAAAKSARGRIGYAYALLYGRPPTAEEEAVALVLVRRGKGERAWAEYCQVLLCANEFIFVD
jgi:hypothetical protein